MTFFKNLFSRKTKCEQYFKKETGRINLKSLSASINKAEFGVGEIEKEYVISKSSTEELQRLDMLQYALCNDINSLDDKSNREAKKMELINIKSQMLSIVINSNKKDTDPEVKKKILPKFSLITINIELDLKFVFDEEYENKIKLARHYFLNRTNEEVLAINIECSDEYLKNDSHSNQILLDELELKKNHWQVIMVLSLNYFTNNFYQIENHKKLIENIVNIYNKNEVYSMQYFVLDFYLPENKKIFFSAYLNDEELNKTLAINKLKDQYELINLLQMGRIKLQNFADSTIEMCIVPFFILKSIRNMKSNKLTLQDLSWQILDYYEIGVG